ncbi:MAG: YicC/YloC family endoribonuclease [Planctomycetia bacterium]|nr:YicC/YloC family endoribonuclease [Planctomycetia bacterium]
MPLSMTGFCEAGRAEGELSVTVRIRSVNNRYLKLSLKVPDRYASLEPEIEAIVRNRVRRGTVQVTVDVVRSTGTGDYRIHTDVLSAYLDQLERLRTERNGFPDSVYASLLRLPGVVEDATVGKMDPEHDWPLLRETLEEAIERFVRMRRREGDAMAADMIRWGDEIRTEVELIAKRMPEVVDDYRDRLEQRICKVMEEHLFTLEPADLVREVALFTDRADVSEEIVRLRSHLDQFTAELKSPECSGRKIEFIVQEMLRETNTIGSKSNDGEITRRVIGNKAVLERIRETLQNLE